MDSSQYHPPYLAQPTSPGQAATAPGYQIAPIQTQIGQQWPTQSTTQQTLSSVTHSFLSDVSVVPRNQPGQPQQPQFNIPSIPTQQQSYNPQYPQHPQYLQQQYQQPQYNPQYPTYPQQQAGYPPRQNPNLPLQGVYQAPAYKPVPYNPNPPARGEGAKDYSQMSELILNWFSVNNPQNMAVSADQIANAMGFAAASDVNPALYHMSHTGEMTWNKQTKPMTWTRRVYTVKNPQGQITAVVTGDVLDQQILNSMQPGYEYPTDQLVRAVLPGDKVSINSRLYALEKRHKLQKIQDSNGRNIRWIRIDGGGGGGEYQQPQQGYQQPGGYQPQPQSPPQQQYQPGQQMGGYQTQPQSPPQQHYQPSQAAAYQPGQQMGGYQIQPQSPGQQGYQQPGGYQTQPQSPGQQQSSQPGYQTAPQLPGQPVEQGGYQSPSVGSQQ